MWGRKWKAAKLEHEASIAKAKADLAHANAVIAHVESHDVEVGERVESLKQRGVRNNFGESLKKAMQQRAEGEQTA